MSNGEMEGRESTMILTSVQKYSQDLDVLTHIFSGASLLLYMLYKNRGADLEDIIAVEPLDVKQTEKVATFFFSFPPPSFSFSFCANEIVG
jgi:hypothetical protein